MKAGIEIEIKGNKCNNCLCSNDCRRGLTDKILCELRNNLTPKLNYKQVPESWEELKELCKDIKRCYVGENYISVSERNISFLNDGQIRCHYYNITNNATPQQMWQIIKNLIGE